MRFWDSSALVPLISTEAASASMERVHREDRDLVVWWGTVIEVESSLARRLRTDALDESGLSKARRLLNDLRAVWSEVPPIGTLRDHAVRLVAVHGLRAVDALQLAAALLAAADRPTSLPFVCLDRRLSQAATREGLPVIPPL